MEVVELTAEIGPDGVLMLDRLPFPAGAPVKVRVESDAPVPAKAGSDAELQAKLDALDLPPELRRMIGIIPADWDCRAVYRQQLGEKQGCAPPST
jgi:hypothetical protein